MRIASLLPSATEIVTALGRADDLVAVTYECDAGVRERCPVVVDGDTLVFIEASVGAEIALLVEGTWESRLIPVKS